MRRLLAIILCAAVLGGCDNTRQEPVEIDGLHLLQGKELAQQKKWDEAIREFETARDSHPESAEPDLQLAIIYHQYRPDYIRAIYHYQCYLEKHPDTEKAPLIEGWIQQVKILLAADVGQSDQGIPEEIIRLKRENNLLRNQLRLMTSSAPRRKPAPKEPVAIQKPEDVKQESTPVSQTPIPRIQTPAPTPETYKVLPGDTLSKIARTIYGDSSKWKEIFGANLDKMEAPNDLKAGETIIIPTLKSKEELQREADAPPLG